MKHKKSRFLTGLIVLFLAAGLLTETVYADSRISSAENEAPASPYAAASDTSGSSAASGQPENPGTVSAGTESQATPEAVPVPMVLISRDDLANPLTGGETRTFNVYFRNLGDRTLKSPVASFSPSDALTVTGGASSFVLPDIPAGGTGSISLSIEAAASITAAGQSLSTELRFYYNNNVTDVQGSVSDKISIPVSITSASAQPVILVSRSDAAAPISSGEVRDVTLNFQNAGNTPVSSLVATVTPSDGLTILNDNSSFLLSSLAPGETAGITVKIQAAKEIASSNQSLSTDLKFNYLSGGTLSQGTASDRVGIPASVTVQVTPAAQIEASVPNIIISSYTYGDAQVTAGSKFKLKATFTNTGKMKIGNIVAAVDGGESFSIDGTTNSFFYSSVDAGASVTQEIPMQALPTAKTGAQSIGFSFKYEYTDSQKRSSATAEIKISVPVYQPDRFQINAPVLPEKVTMGEETVLTLAYVNKGKGDVANVEASVDGSGVDTPAKTQYIGNVAAGASGNIGFSLTPNQTGDIKITLKVSYEGVDQQVVTKEFPLTLHAGEVIPAADSMSEPEESEATFPWGWLIAGAVCAVIFTAAVFILLKKKKSKKTENWEEWDENEETGASDDSGADEINSEDINSPEEKY
jgi:uncharacterized membrane protein